MKKFILASAFAAAIAMGLPLAAEADTKVKVYLGMPHYGYQVGPDYRFRDGYGWYPPLPLGIQLVPRVRHSGFRNVATIECNGRTYTFEATRRGRDVTVFVNSRTGAVWRG